VDGQESGGAVGVQEEVEAGSVADSQRHRGPQTRH